MTGATGIRALAADVRRWADVTRADAGTVARAVAGLEGDSWRGLAADAAHASATAGGDALERAAEALDEAAAALDEHADEVERRLDLLDLPDLSLPVPW